ncbi:MAG: ATP synthase subunit I, partial [Methylococcaceae bacterium]|nr:ATP synthase subunit I [Methylococcaceae bacterium]
MSLFVEVRRVLQYQLLVIAASGSLAYVFGGREFGVSALLCGLIGFLPNVYFGMKFGRKDPSKSADEVVGAFYLGETIKLIV